MKTKVTKYISLTILLIFIVFSSCGKPSAKALIDSKKSDSFKTYNSGKELVLDVQTRVKGISQEEFKHKLQILSEKNLFIVDVRDGKEYDSGHFDFAVNVPRGKLEFKIKQKIDSVFGVDLSKNSEIILICGNGDLSSLGAESLMKLGYTNVSYLKGGYEEFLEFSKNLNE